MTIHGFPLCPSSVPVQVQLVYLLQGEKKYKPDLICHYTKLMGSYKFCLPKYCMYGLFWFEVRYCLPLFRLIHLVIWLLHIIPSHFNDIPQNMYNHSSLSKTSIMITLTFSFGIYIPRERACIFFIAFIITVLYTTIFKKQATNYLLRCFWPSSQDISLSNYYIFIEFFANNNNVHSKKLSFRSDSSIE